MTKEQLLLLYQDFENYIQKVKNQQLTHKLTKQQLYDFGKFVEGYVLTVLQTSNSFYTKWISNENKPLYSLYNYIDFSIYDSKEIYQIEQNQLANIPLKQAFNARAATPLASLAFDVKVNLEPFINSFSYTGIPTKYSFPITWHNIELYKELTLRYDLRTYIIGYAYLDEETRGWYIIDCIKTPTVKWKKTTGEGDTWRQQVDLRNCLKLDKVTDFVDFIKNEINKKKNEVKYVN